MKKDLYIIRKFVKANSIEEVLKKEKTIKPAEIYLSEGSFEKREEKETKTKKLGY